MIKGSTYDAGDMGSIPGLGTNHPFLAPPCCRAAKPESLTRQSESPCATTKTWYSQINNRLLIFGEKKKFCLQRLV